MSDQTKRVRRKPYRPRKRIAEKPEIIKEDEPKNLNNLGEAAEKAEKVEESVSPTYIVDMDELLHQLAILKTGYMQHAPGVFANHVARLCIKHGDGSDISPEEASRLINAKFQN